MLRTIKITETTNTGLPNSYGYARKCMRVVECYAGQNGWKSEKGVVVIWESEHYNANSRGPKSLYRKIRNQAEELANKLTAGITDPQVLHDYLTEQGRVYA